jgi:hypothetical protein
MMTAHMISISDSYKIITFIGVTVFTGVSEAVTHYFIVSVSNALFSSLFVRSVGQWVGRI